MDNITVEYSSHNVRLVDSDGNEIPYGAARRIMTDLASRYPTPAYVYLLYSPKTRLHKIGYTTKEPYDRLLGVRGQERDVSIQIKNTYRFAGAKSARSVERYLHKLLTVYRVHGEWFNLPTPLFEVLEGKISRTWWHPFDSVVDILFSAIWFDYEVNREYPEGEDLNDTAFLAWYQHMKRFSEMLEKKHQEHGKEMLEANKQFIVGIRQRLADIERVFLNAA